MCVYIYIYIYIYICLNVKYPIFLLDLNKTWIFERSSIMKFHKNLSCGSRVVPYTDRQTDITELSHFSQCGKHAQKLKDINPAWHCWGGEHWNQSAEPQLGGKEGERRRRRKTKTTRHIKTNSSKGSMQNMGTTRLVRCNPYQNTKN